MRNRVIFVLCALLLSASRAEAAHLCQHCGCQRNCKKICRLVCGKKKETKTVYECECEDFCVPGHSKKCGEKIECDGDGRHRTIIWQPTCARVRTRRKLVKDEVTKEVPDFKWVVEEYCCVCGHLITVEGDSDQEKAGGKSKAERLPVPPPVTVANESTDTDASATSQADDLGGEPLENTLEETAAGFAAEDHSTLKLIRRSQATFEAPAEERHRLFSGLFGR